MPRIGGMQGINPSTEKARGGRGRSATPQAPGDASSLAADRVIPNGQDPAGGPRVLVTVGTTAFDALVVAASSAPFLDCLRSIGCTSLTLQIGRGVALPFSLSEDNSALRGNGVYVQVAGIRTVRVVRFIPCLCLYLSSYDLVISHCGAASLAESLRAGLRVVACVNPTLLHNHQAELAHQLAIDNHCISLEALGNLPAKILEAWGRPFSAPAASAAAASEGGGRYTRPLVPLPPPNTNQFLRIVWEEVGVYPGLEAPTFPAESDGEEQE